MSGTLFLIAGLGNPGSKYTDTWHNLGQMVVSELARRWNVELKAGKGDFYLADYRFRENKIALMIPTSFMNLSGSPVSAWIRYFNVDLKNTLIVFDDHDLPLGKLRFRMRGSAGGHRGMEDIIRHVGSDWIPRLRIGFSLSEEYPDLKRQVLSKIPKSLHSDVEKIVDSAADAVEMAIRVDFNHAMGHFNGINVLES